MTELSNELVIKKSNITKYVNNLVDKGCIERKYIKNDRRQINLVITEKGKNLEEERIKCWQEYLAEAFEGFEEEDLNTLNKCADNILEILNKYLK